MSFKLLKCMCNVIVRLCSRMYHRIVIEILCGDYIIAILTTHVHRILPCNKKYRRDFIRVISEYYNIKGEQKKRIEASCYWRIKPLVVWLDGPPHP